MNTFIIGIVALSIIGLIIFLIKYGQKIGKLKSENLGLKERADNADEISKEMKAIDEQNAKNKKAFLNRFDRSQSYPDWLRNKNK